jgi:predicted metal-binding membrane protein
MGGGAAPATASGALPRRDKLIILASLAAVVTLAWSYLTLHAAHMNMEAASRAVMGMTGVSWSGAHVAMTLLMWAVMMVAMMLPAAAPMILLYNRVATASAGGSGRGYAAVFAAAYLGIWALFSAAAALAQALAVSSGVVSEMSLAVGDLRLAGALLLLAGLYQLSPLKRACLDACRSPLSFIMRLSRPGAAGALRLGLAHGLYCLGCCWALMLLLFAGGVMDLALIGAIAVLVAVEKLTPQSLRIERIVAALLLAAGAALVIAG